MRRVETALEAAGLPPGFRVLDAGGGAGRHAAVMAERGYRPVVLDLAPAQLSSAGGRPGVAAVQGRTQRMPFRNGSFGLVYFHLSLHYGDYRAALREGARVLAPGGTLWVWTFPRSYLETSFIGRWFPSVRRRDLERFPAIPEVESALATIHLEPLEGADATETTRRPAGEWVAAVRAGFVSTLHLLPPEELAEGLERFVAAHPDPDEVLVTTIHYRGVAARRS